MDDQLDVVVTQSAPKLLHLSPDAQTSIISSFARTCTALSRLRLFLHIAQGPEPNLQMSSQKTRPSRTLEAFSEAVDEQIRRFEAWCSRREERMLHVNPQSVTVVSLLSLEQAIRDEFSETFTEMLNILRQLSPDRRLSSQDDFKRLCEQSTFSPSQFAARLLDIVTSSIHSCNSFGDTATAVSLVHVFEHSVAPLWDMVHRWLSDPAFTASVSVGHDHSSSALPQEFFIVHTGLSIEDSDFWSEAFVPRNGMDLRGTQSISCIPIVFDGVSEDILSAGKSLGLLHLLQRAYGLRIEESLWKKSWVPFDKLVSNRFDLQSPGARIDGDGDSDSDRRIFSPDDLTLLVSEHLRSYCSGVRVTLMEVVTRDLGFWRQLHAIEGLFLMQKSDLTSELLNVIFARVR